MATRQLICCVLGHIDHGKTTILDRIRGTAVQSREPGGITQHTGASEVPLSVIRAVCGPLIKNLKLSLPGLLFIDTPGHQAFSSLRERGGSIADIAVLVVNAMAPLQPQALESIAILKRAKVPFVIAFNKVDTIPGFVSVKGKFMLDVLKSQVASVQGLFEERLYSLVSELSGLGFDSDRFDRVTDFTKQVSIVPTCGVTGEGIPELLMVLTGLAQRYLEKNLEINLDKPASGTVLEVKELKGLGTTLDVIIYDGTLHEGDTIVIGGLSGPIRSKARALLKPAPLQEMREKGDFTNVSEVTAASGVKISGPDLVDVIPGVPLVACRSEEDVKVAMERVQERVKAIIIKTENEGIVIKADSLGSLEALTNLFGEFPVKKGVVGVVTKSDVIEANSVREVRPELGAIITFNVNILPDAQDLARELKIPIFSDRIIYGLLDSFKEFKDKVELEVKRQALSAILLPCKINVLRDHTFRVSGPAIFGVDVIAGTLRVGYPLINEALKEVGHVKSIRDGETVLDEATKGMSVAISVEEGIVGRGIFEDESLFSNVSEEHFQKMKNTLKKYLRPDEIEAMRELLKIHREKDSMWGF